MIGRKHLEWALSGHTQLKCSTMHPQKHIYISTGIITVLLPQNSFGYSLLLVFYADELVLESNKMILEKRLLKLQCG